MSILVSQKILDRISDELSKSTESFLLISAYCKLPLVKYFDTCISNIGIEKKLIVRFRPEDILFGASDLDIYPYCRDNGWKLYFRLDLHAKTYVFDRLRCIIGSANATGSGMNIGGFGNYEMAAVCELAEKDIQALKLLLLGSVEMNDSIYEIMHHAVDVQDTVATGLLQWPKKITDMFQPEYSLLFAEDFPPCAHPRRPLRRSGQSPRFLSRVRRFSSALRRPAGLRPACLFSSPWGLRLPQSCESPPESFAAPAQWRLPPHPPPSR